jgi:hypothetical protein
LKSSLTRLASASFEKRQAGWTGKNAVLFPSRTLKAPPSEPTRPPSESVDHVHPGRPVVVSLPIPRVIKTEFRPEHNRCADVSGEIKRIFRIFPDNSGTLPFLVVEQVGSESKHKLGGDLAIYVVNDRVLGSSAAKLSGGAERAVCAKFRFDGVGNIAGDVRHIALIMYQASVAMCHLLLNLWYQVKS